MTRISTTMMVLGLVVGAATSSTLFAQAPALTIYVPRKVPLGYPVTRASSRGGSMQARLDRVDLTPR